MKLLSSLFLFVLSAAAAAAAVQFTWTDIHMPVEGRRYVYTGTHTNLRNEVRPVEVSRAYSNVQATANGVRFDLTTIITVTGFEGRTEYVETRELTATHELLLRRVERSGSIMGEGYTNQVFNNAQIGPRSFEVGQRYTYSNLFSGTSSGREDRTVSPSLVENVTTPLGTMLAVRIDSTARNATGSIAPDFTYNDNGWYVRNVGAVRLLIGTYIRDRIEVTLASTNFTLAPGTFEGAGPQITADPESLSVSAGTAVSFRVAASGEGLTYAWSKDGAPIPGATAATLVLPTTAPADRGDYRATVTGGGVAVQSKPARLTVYTVTPGERPSLANLSVRAYVGEAGAQLIAGMAIRGTSSPHRMFIRGVGPALTSWVLNPARDPALTVRNAAGAVLAENDDWSLSPDAAALEAMAANVGAFRINPGTKDAVVLVPLGDGNYTALVRDAQGGVGLVECYDADPTQPGGFSNLSARADVRLESLFAGIVVTGGGTIKLLVRAVGPTLGRLGVDGTLADPRVRIVNSSGDEMGANNDWSTSTQKEELRAAFAAVGSFPLDENSRDAAVIVTVPAGNYNAIIDSQPAGGVVLAEVYRLP